MTCTSTKLSVALDAGVNVMRDPLVAYVNSNWGHTSGLLLGPCAVLSVAAPPDDVVLDVGADVVLPDDAVDDAAELLDAGADVGASVVSGA